MAVNNFKELERIQAEEYRNQTFRIGRSIKSNLKTFQFVGDIIELYITRAFGFLSNMSKEEGEQKDDKPDRYPGS